MSDVARCFLRELSHSIAAFKPSVQADDNRNVEFSEQYRLLYDNVDGAASFFLYSTSVGLRVHSFIMRDEC